MSAGMGTLETLREREARIASERRARFLGILACFVTVAFIGMVGGFLIGHKIGFEAGEMAERAKPRPTFQPKPAVWYGLTECLIACRAKDRMQRVAKKEEK